MVTPKLQYDIVLYYHMDDHRLTVEVDRDEVLNKSCAGVCADLGIGVPKVGAFTRTGTTYSRDNSTPPEPEGITVWGYLDEMHDCDEAREVAENLLKQYRDRFYSTAKTEVI